MIGQKKSGIEREDHDRARQKVHDIIDQSMTYQAKQNKKRAEQR